MLPSVSMDLHLVSHETNCSILAVSMKVGKLSFVPEPLAAQHLRNIAAPKYLSNLPRSLVEVALQP